MKLHIGLLTLYGLGIIAGLNGVYVGLLVVFAASVTGGISVVQEWFRHDYQWHFLALGFFWIVMTAIGFWALDVASM